MSDKKILLLRHGETEWNRAMRFQGSVDIPLSDIGERQAVAAGGRIRPWEPEAVFISPLQRTRRTAELALDKAQKNITFVDELREICFGDWEGKGFGDLKKIGGCYDRWVDEPYSVPIPNAESRDSVLERSARVLERIKSCDAEHILLVSHGGILRGVLAVALEVPFSCTWKHFFLSNCSLTGISWDGGRFHLNFYNDCLHLAFLDVEEPCRVPVWFQ